MSGQSVRIRVRSLSPRGFWRGGLFWPMEPTTRDVTEQVAEMLLAESRLVCELVGSDVPAHEPPTAAGAPPTHVPSQNGGKPLPKNDGASANEDGELEQDDGTPVRNVVAAAGSSAPATTHDDKRRRR